MTVGFEFNNKTGVISFAGTPIAPGNGGLTLLAKDTTESSSNITSDTDMATLSGFSIAVGQPFTLEFDFRKTAGAAVNSRFGLKMNSTVVAATINAVFVNMTSVDQAENGHVVAKFGPRDTNYLRAATGYYTTIGLTRDKQLMFVLDADMPTAPITSITIRGNSGSSFVTISVKNVFLWAPPIS